MAGHIDIGEERGSLLVRSDGARSSSRAAETTLPRLIDLVGPARAKRICILCERMNAETALDWGLIDEIQCPLVVCDHERRRT